ncbi:nuatigenin 3-beta-glucosyltransferase-like [Nicotiana tabacum]|uniref:Glycosyltransferase n=1 Tax=Nicotiana sylvestris TaxID=4096 RepID=A0A1U7WAG1_NICSY|nr:PREDICTED: scopoletin glucosyltransferase-like [Nicotiana sylvestris]WIW42739.1 UDP-glycosyltransferase [Nicotiana tabacum]
MQTVVAMDNGNSNGKHQLHVLFLPYLSPGHLIPLVNAARLFASCGVKATILTTPQNALLVNSTINDDVLVSGYSISIQTLPFPSAEVGLPEGVENYSSATSEEMHSKVFYAIFLLQKPMEDKIREIRPDCIFSDMYFPWTVDIAKELNIPRLLFNQSSYIYNSILQNLLLYKPHKEQLKLEQNSQRSSSFLVPGLPDKIELKLSQLTDDLTKLADERNVWDDVLDQTRDSEDRSYGIVHDTFYELEPDYADYYKKIKKTKCWHIGPISYFSSKIRRNELIADNAGGANNDVVEWLNGQKPKSVLYVSFGTLTKFPDDQISEIAGALESSNVPFIWVVRKQTLLPEGFEGKTAANKKGLIIRGWAPQLTILDHSATGGFMTHCGWNSVLEAITAGVPLLTWPLFAEQFYNEKLVEVVGLGVKVGTEIWSPGLEVSSPVLGSEKIKEAIERLMNGSEESKKIREKAMAMEKMAKNAIEEGGSSWNSLTALIDDIKNFNLSSTTAN